MFFSIVVPVYNVEQYLRCCIDSLVRQVFCSYEIILVNDGSTDGCKRICEEYAEKYENIRYVEKENGGLASARNAGLRAANGDYIVFADSDDYIANVFFLKNMQKLIKESDDPDVIVYGYTKFNDSSSLKRTKKNERLSSINALEKDTALMYLMKKDKFSISAWTHIIRKEFLLEHHLYFQEKYKSAEDIEWIFHVLSCMPKIIGADDVSYMYRVRKGSISSKVGTKGFWRYRLKGIQESVCHIRGSRGNSAYKKSLYSCLSYLYYILAAEIGKEKDRKMFHRGIRSVLHLKWITKYHAGRKSGCMNVVLKLFGTKTGSRILGKMI